MKYFGIIFSFSVLGFSLAVAQEVLSSVQKKDAPAVSEVAVPDKTVLSPEKKALKSVMALPPPGTILRKVRMPRFEDDKLTAYLISSFVEMLENNRMLGKPIFIRLYQENGTRTEATLDDAIYDANTGMLQSSKPVTLTDPRFTAQGSKIVLDTGKKTGFLSGPVRTTFSFKTLKESPSPKH